MRAGGISDVLLSIVFGDGLAPSGENTFGTIIRAVGVARQTGQVASGVIVLRVAHKAAFVAVDKVRRTRKKWRGAVMNGREGFATTPPER